MYLNTVQFNIVIVTNANFHTANLQHFSKNIHAATAFKPGLFVCLESELKNIHQAYLLLYEQVCVPLCRRV